MLYPPSAKASRPPREAPGWRLATPAHVRADGKLHPRPPLDLFPTPLQKLMHIARRIGTKAKQTNRWRQGHNRLLQNLQQPRPPKYVYSASRLSLSITNASISIVAFQGACCRVALPIKSRVTSANPSSNSVSSGIKA